MPRRRITTTNGTNPHFHRARTLGLVTEQDDTGHTHNLNPDYETTSVSEHDGDLHAHQLGGAPQ